MVQVSKYIFVVLFVFLLCFNFWFEMNELIHQSRKASICLIQLVKLSESNKKQITEKPPAAVCQHV